MPTKSKSRTTTRRRAARPARPAGLVERLLPRVVPPTHPGEMLLEEFLKPLEISQSAFAIRLGVSFPRLNEIVRGKRSVTPDTALRLARVTGMRAEFWLGLQLDWDPYLSSRAGAATVSRWRGPRLTGAHATDPNRAGGRARTRRSSR